MKHLQKDVRYRFVADQGVSPLSLAELLYFHPSGACEARGCATAEAQDAGGGGAGCRWGRSSGLALFSFLPSLTSVKQSLLVEPSVSEEIYSA